MVSNSTISSYRYDVSHKHKLTQTHPGAALSPVEEVGWGEDSDDEPGTPQPRASTSTLRDPATQALAANASAETTTTPTPSRPTTASAAPPPAVLAEPRKSQDQNSQPDSDASYDLVSRVPSSVPSAAPGSPSEEKVTLKQGKKAPGESDDDEDWE